MRYYVPQRLAEIKTNKGYTVRQLKLEMRIYKVMEYRSLPTPCRRKTKNKYFL
jgi:hypothetical protein